MRQKSPLIPQKNLPGIDLPEVDFGGIPQAMRYQILGINQSESSPSFFSFFGFVVIISVVAYYILNW